MAGITTLVIIGFLLGVSISGLFLNHFYKIVERGVQKLRFKSDKIFNDKIHENQLADELYDKVKVLCWILTSPEVFRTRSDHVKNTWGKRCNKLLFISSKPDQELGAIALKDVKEGGLSLWTKTKKSFQWIYDQKLLNEYDWILKADDDAYMVMENVREMLYQYKPETALNFGERIIVGSEDPDGFMQGGGYILSRKAVDKFVKLYPNCSKVNTWNEDLYMGKCEVNAEDKMLLRFRTMSHGQNNFRGHA